METLHKVITIAEKKNGYYVSQNVHKGSVVRMRENFPQVGLNVGDLVTVDSVPECGGKLLKVILGSGGEVIFFFSHSVEILGSSETLASKK